eukprot:CAMPEP_0196796302 /NCGR_PEP_ID=MMETSP1104-20130614/37338_1 /TAXON_ID=33652 /ORGANISM="Cafeteria sp., Strain Caron Lab Isolate" /LENGTH=62 /DNA_ID=CAMNT_0042166693 /DNA_START=419 /DNA_END=603 /DNA_ORIENTATION=-
MNCSSKRVPRTGGGVGGTGTLEGWAGNGASATVSRCPIWSEPDSQRTSDNRETARPSSGAAG